MLITRADDKMRRFDFKDYVFFTFLLMFFTFFLLIIDNSAWGWIKFSRISDYRNFETFFLTSIERESHVCDQPSLSHILPLIKIFQKIIQIANN